GNPGLFQMAGVQCRLEMVGGMPVCYDFSKTEYAEELITPYRVLVSPDHFGSSYLTDNNITSFWSLDPEAVKHGSVFIEFNETESLHKIVLFPEKADNSPDEFSIRVSRNNRDWETVFQTKEGQPVFWSEAHPFIKLVKPRMEIVLPDRPGIKYCEIIFDVEKRKNALSICEMLLVKRMEKISSDRKTRERAEIIASLFENHRNKVIVGDHWWCNYFHLHGFPVDFISNQSVNNCGLPNPNLSCGVALNFSKNHVLIAEKTHARSIENKLNACHIPFQKKSYLFRDLYDIPPNHTRSLLYWNGLQLNDILPVDAGRFYYPYPLLKNIFPQAVPSSFVFGDKLKMTAFYFQTDRDKRSVTLFLELLPLVSLEKDYYLFIHYCDDKGRVLFQGDVKMEHFRKPTSLWQDNMRVLMERTVWIPVFVTGKVFIKTGIWHPDSGKQLKIERQTKKETHVILGSFDI
ncbi:MAG: discoidin domain-containing protein, partial [Candidatus Aureabacteria bacterium]|nr:discoidin domain-containing protein [Candidatus Auribacterota bacterium]